MTALPIDSLALVSCSDNYINHFVFQACTTQVSALHAQKDFTASLRDGQTKQDSVNRVISASKVLQASSKKYALLDNIAQQALTLLKTVPSAHILMQPDCGKQSNALTVQLGHTALSQEGHTPLDHAVLGFIVLLDPVWIMLCHVLLVCIVPKVSDGWIIIQILIDAPLTFVIDLVNLFFVPWRP